MSEKFVKSHPRRPGELQQTPGGSPQMYTLGKYVGFQDDL